MRYPPDAYKNNLDGADVAKVQQMFFVPFPFRLVCLLLSCLVLSCLVLSCLVCLVLSCLVFSCLVSSTVVYCCLVLFGVV
jgi:hypothetical protein